MLGKTYKVAYSAEKDLYDRTTKFIISDSINESNKEPEKVEKIEEVKEPEKPP